MPRALLDFFRQHPTIQAEPHRHILRYHQVPQHIYFVQSGYVRQYITSHDGQELTLQIYKPGSYFYLSWALNQEPNRYDFVTLTETELYQVPLAEVKRFLELHPQVLFDLTQRVFRGIDQLLFRMQTMSFGTARQKVAAMLVQLTQRFGQPDQAGHYSFPLPITHKDIAAMTGLTRETVSMQMSQLKKSGVLDSDQRMLVVINLPKLEEQAQLTAAESVDVLEL